MSEEAASVALSPGGPRAIVTGSLLGAALSICNLYSGLKLGWSTSMGISGAILAHAVWKIRTSRARSASPFSQQEAIVSSTAAAGAAAVSSTGLVAGIPALTLLTGRAPTWPVLAAWVFGVCFLGASIAALLARSLVTDRSLTFPNGVAIRETVRQLDAPEDGIGRARTMLVAAISSGIAKTLIQLRVLTQITLPGHIGGYSLTNLTWSFDPSLLLMGIGGLIGPRVCMSVLLGSSLAYLGAAPALLHAGMVPLGNPEKSWFRDLVAWLMWPGVSLMVSGSLVTFALSWRKLASSFRALGASNHDELTVLPRTWLMIMLATSSILALVLLRSLYGVGFFAGVVALLLTFALSIVGGRAQGETGVTPVGPMARVTQLASGLTAPGDVGANLMTATLTGGAVSEGTELLSCLRAGRDLGASPSRQWIAHVVGSAAGASVGAAAYLVLLPAPSRQLFTEEWPAPAVAQWKAIAEVMCRGLAALPPHAAKWAAIAAAMSIVLGILEARVSPSVRKYLPSPASVGLGFVMPAQQGLSLFVGGVIALVIARAFPKWSKAAWVVVCGGVIAGESFVGVIWSAISIVR